MLSTQLRDSQKTLSNFPSTAMSAQTFQFDLSSIDAARKGISSIDAVYRKVLVDALESVGVKLNTSVPRRKSSPSKKVSLEEKHGRAFDSNLCHARLLKQKTHPAGHNTYKNPNKQTHLDCVDFQCCAEIHQENMCKACFEAETKKCTEKACAEKGNMPFGSFEKPLSEDILTRKSKNNGKQHTYVMEGSDELAKYDDYLNDPDEHVTKKSSNSSVESDADLDWKSIVCNDEWDKYKITNSMMKTHLKSIDCDTKGNKKVLIARIIEKYTEDDNQSQESEQHEQPEQPEHPNPAAAQASESNDVVEDDVMPAPQQDDLDSIADADEHQIHNSDFDPANPDACINSTNQDESDESDDDESDDDVKQEIIIQGVQYTQDDNGIFYIRPHKRQVCMSKDPNCTDPQKWDDKMQQKHAKYLQNVQGAQ